MEEHQIPQDKEDKAVPEINPEKTLFQNPPNLPPMEKDHRPIMFLVIIPIIFIIIGAAFFISFNKKNKGDEQPVPTEKLKLTLAPTLKLGISTEWTEYQSSSGYRLKYPSNWQVYSTSWEENGQLFNLTQEDEVVIRFREPDQPAHSGDPYGTTISLRKPVDNPNNLSVGDWLKENLPVLSFVKTENTTVAGINSIKATTLLGGKYIYIYIPYQGKIYQLVNHSFTTKDAPSANYQNLYDYEDVFNQILTTLSFPASP
ncbi:MAG: hypothetical protein M1450_03215 [Patescibacteria group bacterium]|nr:hypothetical protein [Patescibacteria group bacterium]